ncbi:MAG: ABC transporter substrate-binding protein [Arthrobacter sp.]|jgi:iron complex transport system substrate-binding protein|nr:ABC transporter substrate-binding protein [Arthrobacter sp.]
MSTRHRLFTTAGAALAALAMLTSCGAQATGGAAASQDASPAAQDRTIEDPAGHEVTVPGEIKAALGFYTTDVDILMTLGIPLAKSQPIRGDSGYTTFPSFFPQEPLQDVTPFANYPEFNYEKVLDAEPDFILNGLGYDTKIHDKLAAIAPTYTVNAFDGTPWIEHFEQTAKDLGRETQYTEWVEKTEDRAGEIKQAIKDAGNADLTVATFGYWDGKANVSCYSGVECEVFKDLGLKVTPLSADKDLTIAPEELDKLKDVDAIWMSKGLGESGDKEFEETIATLERSPLWKDLPFVKNKRIYTFEMEMTYGSPSGMTGFMEQVRKDLTGAAS